MAADASQGSVRADEFTRTAEIACPQDKLDQVAHRNCVHWF
jgi:hypothetical protein